MPLTTGQSICNGKYRIEELIGEGSFARVWKAQEFDIQGHALRFVAIKELKREMLSGQELAEQEHRFQREIRVSAQLFDAEVPNVVRALTTETLTLDDGTQIPLLVTEHMPGGNLADLIAVHPQGMALERALRIAMDVCAALKGLHGIGIVHRDVKPCNMLLRSPEGTARLADFGTVQLQGKTVSGSRTLGTAGYHPGSPDYMPKEQLPPRQDYLQPSADIFALGCALFEMLTGMPYRRAQRQKKGLRDLRPEVPAAVEAVVAKALAQDPEARYEDGEAFAAALEVGFRDRDAARMRLQTEAKLEVGRQAKKREERVQTAPKSRRVEGKEWHPAFWELISEIITLVIALVSLLWPRLWPGQVTDLLIEIVGFAAAAAAMAIPARRGIAVWRARQAKATLMVEAAGQTMARGSGLAQLASVGQTVSAVIATTGIFLTVIFLGYLGYLGYLAFLSSTLAATPTPAVVMASPEAIISIVATDTPTTTLSPTPVPTATPSATWSPTSTPTATSMPPPATPVLATDTPEPLTDTPVPQPYAIIPAGGLNVRRGPGTGYEALGVAQSGQRLDIVARNAAGDWWQVCCLAGERGWVSSGLVQSGGEIGALPLATDIPALPTPTPAPEVAGPPSLVEPANGAGFRGPTTVLFRWEWSGRLAANQWFDIAFRQGDNLAFRQTKERSLTLGDMPLAYGEIEWWVRVGEWEGDPAAGGQFLRHVGEESEHWRVLWDDVRRCRTEQYECNCRWETDPITLERKWVCDTCTREVCD